VLQKQVGEIMDTIGDMLTRIRNGHGRSKTTVNAIFSKTCESILKVLVDEGYIRGYSVETNAKGFPQLRVELKYFEGRAVIQRIERRSTPGRRVYSGFRELKPFVNGLGIHILSTSHGIMSDIKARSQGVGGEVLCSVF
jgi:small subunit ribosomal protein S8